MSNLRLRADVRSFKQAEEFLDGRARRTLGYNTVVRERTLPSDLPNQCERVIDVVYHQTAIVTYDACGDITLWTNGYHTLTTANRMDLLTPMNVRVSKRGRYLWVQHDGDAEVALDNEPVRLRDLVTNLVINSG